MIDEQAIPQTPSPFKCLHDLELGDLQFAQNDWAEAQPWDRGQGEFAALGMIEELGELVEALGYPAGSDPDLAKAFCLMQKVGRFAHATLKRLQGIRGTEAEHRMDAQRELGLILAMSIGDYSGLAARGVGKDQAALEDAIGDVSIYMMDLANKTEVYLPTTIADTCEKVFARNWTRFLRNGVTE